MKIRDNGGTAVFYGEFRDKLRDLFDKTAGDYLLGIVGSLIGMVDSTGLQCFEVKTFREGGTKLNFSGFDEAQKKLSFTTYPKNRGTVGIKFEPPLPENMYPKNINALELASSYALDDPLLAINVNVERDHQFSVRRGNLSATEMTANDILTE